MSRGMAAIFCGNLPSDVREREIEDLFYKYGRILSIDLKTPPRPPAYCFIEFSDPRDAEDAVAGRDNYDFHGNRLRVELSRGGGGGGSGGGGGGGGGGRYGGGGGSYGSGGGYGGSSYGGGGGGYRDSGGPRGGGGLNSMLATSRARGSAYRAIVKGLPISASWQDLKDHFRKVVKPSYTNVVRDRGAALGIVEFDTAEDLDRAIRKLDDTEFKNPFDRTYIRIYEDDAGGKRARSRSRSRSRARSSRSRSYSSRSASSRSRSRSKSRSASGSRSRSRSASGDKAVDNADDKAEGEEARDNGDKAMSRSPTPEEAAKDVSPTLSNE